jgi:GNAT superfamily N-acetyltransferase
MIQTRICNSEDFDQIVVLLRQLWPGKPQDLVSLRQVYDRSMASDRQVYLCAVVDTQVLGFGSLTIKNNLWCEGFLGFVDELVVDEAHRGKGIGTKLLDDLISWARERGCRRVELDSSFHRTAAHVFYERYGFQSRAYLYSKSL